MLAGERQEQGFEGWTGSGRFLAGALVTASVLALLPAGAHGQEPNASVAAGSAVTSQAGGFSDVPAGHTFADDVEWLASTGITQGRSDGTFGLNEPVTRGAMAAFLFRYDDGHDRPSDPPAFPDVPGDHVFADAIAWLASTGITQGRNDGTFGLNDPVTRGAMAAFLHRFADTPAGSSDAVAGFPDVPAGHVFTEPVTWLAATEITQGREDGTFGLNDPVTRGAMAALLNRYDRWSQRSVTIASQSLPAAAAGLSYGVALESSGGQQPYRWRVSDLPAGLTATPEGTVEGVPTTTGTWSVLVEVTDASGATATSTLSLLVLDAAVPAECFAQDCALLEPFTGDEVRLDDGTTTTRRTLEPAPDAIADIEIEVDSQLDGETGGVAGTAELTLLDPALVPRPDDVLVIPTEVTPDGHLGPVYIEVASIRTTDTGTAVEGVLVGLLDAYAAGTLHLLDADAAQIDHLGVAELSAALADAPLLSCETETEQRIDAGVAVTPDIDVFINWRFGVPTRLDVHLDLQVDARAELAVTGQATCRVDSLPSITLVKGPAVLRLRPGIAIDAEGAAQLDLEASYGCTAGFGYRNDRDSHFTCTDRDSNLTLPDHDSRNTAHASFQIELRPSITVVDALGVRGTLAARLDAHLTPLEDPLARLDLSAPTELEGCVGCDLPRIGDLWTGTFLEHTQGPITLWQLPAPPAPAPTDGFRFQPFTGLSFVLPAPSGGTWSAESTSDRRPLSATARIDDEGFWSSVNVRQETEGIDGLLAEQERLYREYDYIVPDQWYVEMMLPGTDRAVHYLWGSPSGDLLIDTLLLAIGEHTVSIDYSRHIDSRKQPPPSDVFVDTLRDSLEIDRELLGRTLSPG